jgi:transposase
MPLLQRAIASRYERSENEIEMGVQQLDGSGIDIQKNTS